MLARVDQKAFGREKRRLDRLFKEISNKSLIAAKNSADEYVSTVKSGIGVTHSPTFAPHWDPLSQMWMAMKKDYKDKFWAETYGIYRAIGTKIISKTIIIICLFISLEFLLAPLKF